MTTQTNQTCEIALEEKVDFLSQPFHYPDKTSKVEVDETHMSWVFLTDHYVYKLKKPIQYNHHNLSALDDREKNCFEEVRLNRRLARDIYLGVVALSVDEDRHLTLEKRGNQIVDWLVKMKRLPDNKMLDYQMKQEQGNDGRCEKSCCRTF